MTSFLGRLSDTNGHQTPEIRLGSQHWLQSFVQSHVANISKAIALQSPTHGKSCPPLLQALIWPVIMLHLFSAWSICSLLKHEFFILFLQIRFQFIQMHFLFTYYSSLIKMTLSPRPKIVIQVNHEEDFLSGK